MQKNNFILNLASIEEEKCFTVIGILSLLFSSSVPFFSYVR